MSWTEERALRRYFRRQLVPLARALRARGVTFFPLGPDEAESWYEEPPTGPEFVSLDPAAALQRIWEEQGLPELARQTGELAALARKLETGGRDADDVSPFIYVMH